MKDIYDIFEENEEYQKIRRLWDEKTPDFDPPFPAWHFETWGGTIDEYFAHVKSEYIRYFGEIEE